MQILGYAVAAVLANVAQAHMYLAQPPALSSKDNPLTQEKDRDYTLTTPLSSDGSNYPCKGSQKLLGTASGGAVAKWQAGSTYDMAISGGASHGGGSCQASLSYDGGKTFKVIHAWIGGCPGTSPTRFRVPSDAPAGEKVLFAWTWLNRIGNRELYMNCASVDIASTGGGSGEKIAFKDRPSPFVANLNNGCRTTEGSDVLIPDPGPDVDKTGSQFSAPVGNCGAKVGSSSRDGAGPSPGTSPARRPDPVPTLPGSAPGPNAAADAGSPAPGSPSPGSSSSPGYKPGNRWPVPLNAAAQQTVRPSLVYAVGLMLAVALL